MFLLSDATAFYASCEKIFEPALRSRPVLIAGSNDGIVIALCPIAKRLGFKKFHPVFMQRQLINKTGAIVRSANFELYGEVSRRMHSILSEYGRSYAYSIDEAFVDLTFVQSDADWFGLGRAIRRRLWDELRLPMCCGFGETLTLAKAANHASKRLPGFRGVAVIKNDVERERILSQMDVTDIWGIGDRIGKRLKLVFNIRNGLELAQANQTSLRRAFNINVANTVSELNGEPALFWDDIRAPKKQIFSTRTVSRPIQCLDDLKRAITSHALNVCRKAREQQSLISQLVIFARTSRFAEAPAGSFNCLISFSTPSSCYKKVAAAVSLHIERHYVPGDDFNKIGAGAIALTPERYSIADLFTEVFDDQPLSGVIDSVNQRFGKGAVSLASTLNTDAATFMVSRQNLSPRYLTAWHQVPRVFCK